MADETNKPGRWTAMDAVVCVACVGCFLFDAFAPLGVAGGVPYVLVILLAVSGGLHQRIWFYAIACLLLTILGIIISPPPGPTAIWKVAVNRLLAAVAIIVAALLGKIHQRELRRVQETAEELRRQTVQLKRSNDELDGYAWAAAHDLQSPMRGISNLVGFIEDDADSLNEECRDHLRQLDRQAGRMQNLLSGLLTYSQVGNNTALPKELDCFELVRDVMDSIHIPAGFSWDSSSVKGKITGRVSELKLVLRHLIENALKHHDKAGGKITIRTHHDEEGVAFSVEDDGPGIPRNFQEQVFELYRTLKRKDEVEGSGMGLAIVKKAVELHGGRAWLTSDGERGTACTVWWPRQWVLVGSFR